MLLLAQVTGFFSKISTGYILLKNRALTQNIEPVLNQLLNLLTTPAVARGRGVEYRLATFLFVFALLAGCNLWKG